MSDGTDSEVSDVELPKGFREAFLKVRVPASRVGGSSVRSAADERRQFLEGLPLAVETFYREACWVVGEPEEEGTSTRLIEANDRWTMCAGFIVMCDGLEQVLDEPTAERLLDEFIERGWIEVIYEYGPGEGALYRLLVDPETGQTFPPPDLDERVERFEPRRIHRRLWLAFLRESTESEYLTGVRERMTGSYRLTKRSRLNVAPFVERVLLRLQRAGFLNFKGSAQDPFDVIELEDPEFDPQKAAQSAPAKRARSEVQAAETVVDGEGELDDADASSSERAGAGLLDLPYGLWLQVMDAMAEGDMGTVEQLLETGHASDEEPETLKAFDDRLDRFVADDEALVWMLQTPSATLEALQVALQERSE